MIKIIAETVETSKERTLSPLLPEIIAVLCAAVSGILLVLPLEMLLGFLDPIPFLNVLSAPLCEEPFKVLGLVYLAFVYPGVLKTKKDGLWLGLLGAIGFMFVENFLYAIVQPGGIVMRGVIFFPGHLLYSAFVGMGIVFLAQRSFDRSSLTAATVVKELLTKEVLSFLALGMLFHYLFNFFAGYEIVQALVLIAAAFILYKVYKYLPERMDTVRIDNPIALVRDALGSRKKAPLASPAYAGTSGPVSPTTPAADRAPVAVQVPVRVRAASASSTTAAVPPVPAPAPAPVPVIAAPAPAASHKICNRCGAECKVEALFCGHCGNKL
ncbi:MAG TPA: PrsW family glutamic-type intramembrane protease [Methanocella sp.]